MTPHEPRSRARAVLLREVTPADVPIFFEHESDPLAARMASSPIKGREEFMAHWAKIMADETITIRAILFDGQVAGNLMCFQKDGKREVGYWVGKEFWGRGVATRALSLFLQQEKTRPLYAHVAKDNIASRRVLEKCGFTLFGEDKGESFIPGEQVEDYVLILKTSV